MGRLRPSPAIGLALLTIFALVGVHAAEPRHAQAVRECMLRQREKPSVHSDRDAIDRALAQAGVSDDQILALHHAAAQANLPSMTASLDAFLFFTQDPQWQSYRRHFAEFLELPNLFAIDAETMRILSAYDGVVTLPGITELSPQSASACGHFGQGGWGTALEFPNVSAITPAAATRLAKCQTLLVFPHLREVSLDTARLLATSTGTGLVLGGLTTLPPDVAQALSTIQTERGLLLTDLVVLDSVPLAKRFAKQDHAFFPALERMPPEVAKALRTERGGELALPALGTITRELAEEFVGAGYYWIALGGAGTLTPDAAAVLANHHGPLAFPGHDTFSPEAASKLAAHRHAIMLPQLATVPADVLRSLATHEGTLVLSSVSSLTPEDAKGIVAHAGSVSLPVLERLPPDVAAILAPRLDEIDLPAVATIDGKSASALATHARDEVRLEGLKHLSPEAATALAAFEGSLLLPAVTTLSPEAARALASHRGALLLGVTEELDGDTMAVLATHRGDLWLPGVTAVSEKVGRHLAAAPGTLGLPAVARIDPHAAQALLARTKPLELGNLLAIDSLDSAAVAELIVRHFEDVELQNVVSLTGPQSGPVARALAKTKGELSLPSLEEISTRALEILLAHPDVHLPERADLEIVETPSQLGHDDYVDPRP